MTTCSYCGGPCGPDRIDSASGGHRHSWRGDCADFLKLQLSEAKAEVERLKDQVAYEQVEAAERECKARNDAKLQVSDLKAKLTKYGSHTRECDVNYSGSESLHGPKPCDCGWEGVAE